MIDFIKIQCRDQQVQDLLFNHPKLEWIKEEQTLHHFQKDVIVNKVNKHYKGVLFTFTETRVDITFKPHYYFNDNQHNANDFSVSNCIKVIKELGDLLGIDLAKLEVTNLEFGVNVISSHDIKDVITFMYSHGRNEFRNDVELAYSKKSFTINKHGKANKFKVFKAYAKGIHHPEHCEINTFRFEYKTNRSKRINGLYIKTLADLLNPEAYRIIGNSLIAEFEKVLILDNHASRKNLTPKERIKFEKYLNPYTWYAYLQKSRNVFDNHVKKYDLLQKKVGKTIKSELMQLIRDKVIELTNDP